ncbi:MAG: DUF5106 domain-containing protein [Bacteroidales bacterium]|nr:DUF5106 domain-containing protein [Bacteroidales bacterium]
MMKRFERIFFRVFVYLLATVLLAVSCKGTVEEKARTRAFPLVSVPSLLSQNEVEARIFTLKHYWDRFADTTQHGLLCDSLHIGGVAKGDVEQAFSNWMYVMMEAGPASYETAVGSFYDRLVLCEQADSSSNIYEGTVDIACRYLYDPNSPMRDEEIYLPLCRRLAESPLQDSLQRAKYAKQAAGCSLNRIGTKAADFAFSDKNGRIRTLYGIKADWTLLFFSNPGCHACKDIIETLKAMPGLDQMIADKKLAVVNVYIDEDMTGWYDYMPYYPDNWYNGYDHNLVIRTDHLYDVRAIPSLYLLDKDKKVVLKDAPENRMYHQLETLL